MTSTDNSGPADAALPFLLVRLRPAVGLGERKRLVHMVSMPDNGLELPDVLAAWCGFEVKPGEAEMLGRFTGMPCAKCLAFSPSEEGARLRRAISDFLR